MVKNFLTIYISAGDKCQSMMTIAVFDLSPNQYPSGFAPASIFKPAAQRV
jgi:hypothetical protein